MAALVKHHLVREASTELGEAELAYEELAELVGMSERHPIFVVELEPELGCVQAQKADAGSGRANRDRAPKELEVPPGRRRGFVGEAGGVHRLAAAGLARIEADLAARPPEHGERRQADLGIELVDVARDEQVDDRAHRRLGVARGVAQCYLAEQVFRMDLVEKLRRAGVVGAGGGGFPTYAKVKGAKLGGRAEIVIANGAECEPLLHKDAAVMEHRAEAVVAGLRSAMEATGACRGVVALKRKRTGAARAIERALDGRAIELRLLDDYYPAGDEYDLVYTVTGRQVPPAGIPLEVGVLVINVETLTNLAAAAEGQPVTHKTITLGGAVKNPVTVAVPIGTSVGDALAAAGGARAAHPVFFVGGVMMGEMTSDPGHPVTKTTAGVVVLPATHALVERRARSAQAKRAVGKSACDQCRYCTELCPRYLLGYRVEPHQVMRGLAFSPAAGARWGALGLLCSACGLCTLYACPESLYPKEACDDAKLGLGRVAPGSAPPLSKPHGLRDARRVPTRALMSRLGIAEYDRPAPLAAELPDPERVVLLLRQGAGAAGEPAVRRGDLVRSGQPLTTLGPDALGVPIHAPYSAIVSTVEADRITLARRT
jgi:Na+-translocating ferredoxin:NAD+ oxidoreductase RnfC subunit